MSTGSIAVEEALLLLKLGFLVLLYLFLWTIVRSAARDLRTPQESFVLAPQRQRRRAAKPAERPHGRLVVVGGSGAALPAYELDSVAVTVGRGPGNDIALDDPYASALHARVEARQDGVWIEDVGSTNGTLVNGERIAAAHKLSPGDVVRIGGTELRFEQ